MDLPRFDQTTHNELLLAIQWYLSQSPCQEAATALRREIEQHNLLPIRYDFNGIAHPQSLCRFESIIPTGQPTIVTLIEKLNALICKLVPPVISKLPIRIFTSQRQSLCRNNGPKKKLMLLDNIVANKSSANCHAARMFHARQLGRRFSRCQMLQKESVHSLDLHCRISGHLSSVFCVAFDRSGHYIFTGADDFLVKVWSATNAVLRFTFRGHCQPVTDISVSDDNSMIASGSIDKTVRVWSLHSAAMLALLRNHTAAVTLVTFLPFVSGQTRYLLSTGGDCVANFYKYNSDDGHFGNPEHICFNERKLPGSRLVSSCCSPGGSFVVLGDTHHILHIYRLSEDSVCKIKDIEAHTDRVDSLAWAHSGLRFLSGSKDGIARVWRFQYNDWQNTVLDAKKCDEKTAGGARRAYKVTMACWSLDDNFVVTSGSDHALRVWDSKSGEPLRMMEGHKEDTYVMVSHPVYREYVFSAGHDGLLMIWNICEGTLVKRYQNQEEVNGSVPLFDFSISPDGTFVAAVDSVGRLSIFGMGASQKVKTTPKEQFLNTDYMPVTYDSSGELVDEDTSVAPHLLPPARLVDGDGVVYSDDIQRLIPGRDSLTEDYANDGAVLQSPWLSRDLVPRQPSSTLNILNGRLFDLRGEEAKEFGRETLRQKPRDIIEVEQINRQAGLLSRRKDTVRTNGSLHTNRRQQQNEEREEEMGPEEAVPSGSSADSTFGSASSSGEEEDSDLSENTSDSEYTCTERARTRRTRPLKSDVSIDSKESNVSCRRTSRPPKPLLRYVVDDDSDGNSAIEDPDEPGPSHSSGLRNRERKQRRQSRKKILSTSSDAAGTSASSSSAVRASPTSGLSHETSSGEPASAKKRSCSTPVVDFPEWMRFVKPLRFPYIAQIGDVVVYLRQGHEQYLSTVEALGLYPVTPRMKPLPHLDAEERCLVTEVKYSRKPFRLITVRLARLDSSDTPTGLLFSVRYHDLENVPDFIILHHIYNESVNILYEPGDRIEAILDRHWWSGTVDKNEPYDEVNFPRSHWFSLTIRWDTGEDEKMSPWDVQMVGVERRTGSATEEELIEYSHVPRQTLDWISTSKTAEDCERMLIEAIEILQGEEEVRPFSTPVNLNEYPEYTSNVDYPIDLETIGKRAANQYYRRFVSMEQDIKYIAVNASLFNEPRSSIVHNSRVLVETLLRYLTSSGPQDALALFMSLKDVSDNELVEYKRSNRIEVASVEQSSSWPAVLDGSHNMCLSAINYPHQEWVIDCNGIIDTMSQQSFGRLLIDGGSEMVSDAVADGCRSLTGISQAIAQRVYEDPCQVVEDMKKLLQSCRDFIDDQRSPLCLQSLQFSSRFDRAMEPILAKWRRLQQLVENNQHESECAVGHRLRNRRKKTSAYNTRQRKDGNSKSEGSSGPSVLRNGRSAKMPNGFYRDLNSGKHQSNEEGSHSNERRKLCIRAGAPSNARAGSSHVIANKFEGNESGPSSPLVNGDTRNSVIDEMDFSDVPGPSNSNNETMSNGRTAGHDLTWSRADEDDESRSEDESLVNGHKKVQNVDEDFIPEENSSADLNHNASDSSYSEEGSQKLRRSGRVRKRRRLHDAEAPGTTGTLRESKRTKQYANNRSISPEMPTSKVKREGSKSRKRRAVSGQGARASSSAYVTERTPESGEISDEVDYHATRSCRSRDRRINYNEDDSPEEEPSTSVSSRGRIRKHRLFR